MQPAAPHDLSSTQVAVFDRVLADIVGGRYPAGTRLPPERDLARMLGASRPTLREALRRLGEWGLVSARQGSGVTVRPVRDWSLAVLPAFLRLGAPGLLPALDPASVGRFVGDLLAIRRLVIVEALRIVAPRVSPGSLDEARAAVRRAWEARGDVTAFLREDFEVLRAVVEAARLLPALWLLNDLAGVYLGVARTVGGAAFVSEDYPAVHAAVFEALERGDGEGACRRMSQYLDALDERLVKNLGVTP